MVKMNIRQATEADVLEVARLALMLWPEHSMHAIALEIYETINSKQGAFFLAYDEEVKEAVGFSQVSLRNDYVEGTKNTPVGYLEGLFVLEGYRLRGIGQELLRQCEVA